MYETGRMEKQRKSLAGYAMYVQWACWFYVKRVSGTCTSFTPTDTEILPSYLNLSIRRIICWNFL